MAYATLADIEARYPGELAQAGPRDGTGALDEAAIARALDWSSESIDRYLRTIGWATPVAADPLPDWLVLLTVDLALYQATPTALASQTDFADRRRRYADAVATLEAIASGEVVLEPLATGAAPAEVLVAAADRLFTRGVL